MLYMQEEYLILRVVEELLKTWDSLGFNDINLKIIRWGDKEHILQENYKSDLT